MEGSPDRQGEHTPQVQSINEEWVDNEHLKNVIVSLSSKIVTTTDLEKEIVTYQTIVKDHEEARDRLRGQLGEASSSANQRAQETSQRESSLNDTIEAKSKEINELTNIIRDRENTIHTQVAQLNERDKEIVGLNAQLANLSEMKDLNEQLNENINDAEKARVDLQNKFNKCLDDHHQQLDQEHDERQKLINDKNQVIKEKLELNQKYQEALEEIEDLKKQLGD